MKPAMKNALTLVMIIALIALVALASQLIPRSITPNAGSLGTAEPIATEAPAATDVLPASEATEVPDAEAYLVVTVNGMIYEPIPLYQAGRYTVRQGDMVNVIEVTRNSVCMAESTCDNQDCVEQGVVSLDNINERVLHNAVICLPNQVTLELYDEWTLANMLVTMFGEAETGE